MDHKPDIVPMRHFFNIFNGAPESIPETAACPQVNIEPLVVLVFRGNILCRELPDFQRFQS